MKTTEVDLLVRDPIIISKDSTVNRVSSNNGKKANKTRFEIRSIKSKNIVKLDFLTKFKLLIEPSAGLGFNTPTARLIFAKLRQAFIKVPILYYFNPEYYI